MSKAAPAEPDQDDMQAHADLHHLVQAAKVRAHPKRHKAAMAKHAEMLAALQQVAQQSQQQPQGAPGGAPMPAGPAPTANGGAY